MVFHDTHYRGLIRALTIVGGRENGDAQWFVLLLVPIVKLESIFLELVGAYERLQVVLFKQGLQWLAAEVI